jgi:serine phosphatase RsbU (regulator of sigma subunit)
MLGISFLNDIVVERKIMDAAEILEKLREKIINALVQKKAKVKQRDGMDIALCVWNKSTDILEFAGANNPLWILRNEINDDQAISLLEFKPDKIPVGQYGDDLETFTQQSIQLKKEDMIYSFSDGFSDQFGGPNGKKLRSANFKRILLECAHLTGSEQKTILAEKFLDWKGQMEQIDDVCVIGIRVK